MHEIDIVPREDAREYYPEKIPVGTLIAFKPARGDVRLRAAPAGHATIVVFTGVWQERSAEQTGAPNKTCAPGSRKAVQEKQRQAGRSARIKNISIARCLVPRCAGTFGQLRPFCASAAGRA